MQVHGVRTACALHVHCMCTACALYVHCMCTACALHVHCMHTACALHVYYQVCPNWLIMLLLVLLCGYSGQRTLSKAVQQRAKESRAQTSGNYAPVARGPSGVAGRTGLPGSSVLCPLSSVLCSRSSVLCPSSLVLGRSNWRNQQASVLFLDSLTLTPRQNKEN